MKYHYFANQLQTMSSVKVRIASKRYSDGKSPVLIQYNVKGKRISRQLFTIDPVFWDHSRHKVKKTHDLHFKLNRKIQEAILKGEEIVFASDTEQEAIHHLQGDSSDILAELIRNKIKRFQDAGKHRSAWRYESALTKILKYDPNARTDISVSWIQGYEGFLLSKGLKLNTIAKEMSIIRSILNDAEVQDNPFKKYKIRREKTMKEVLTRDEIQALANQPFPESVQLAVDAFLLCYYLRGRRIGDCLQFKIDDIRDGRLYYRPEKTGGKRSMKVSNPALVIIKKYKGGEYLLPYLDGYKGNKNDYQKKIDTTIGLINRNIKRAVKILGIKKRITTHTARHSFALHFDEHGASLNQIKEALDHATIVTTAIYMQSIRKDKDLDEAVEGMF